MSALTFANEMFFSLVVRSLADAEKERMATDKMRVMLLGFIISGVLIVWNGACYLIVALTEPPGTSVIVIIKVRLVFLPACVSAITDVAWT